MSEDTSAAAARASQARAAQAGAGAEQAAPAAAPSPSTQPRRAERVRPENLSDSDAIRRLCDIAVSWFIKLTMIASVVTSILSRGNAIPKAEDFTGPIIGAIAAGTRVQDLSADVSRLYSRAKDIVTDLARSAGQVVAPFLPSALRA